MFLSKIVSLAAMPLAATADEIQPWMIAAIAAGALLALLLIIIAARKSRGPKGEDLREAMSAAKEEAAERMDWADLASEGVGVDTAESKLVVPEVALAKEPKGASEKKSEVTPAKESEVTSKKKSKDKPSGKSSKGRGKHAK